MSGIGSVNDLVKQANGSYTLAGGKNNGFITADNGVLNQLWTCEEVITLGPNFVWGTTPYDGTDKAWANVKKIRFWNPGATKENCYVELTGYEGSNGTAKFVIEDASGNQVFQKYFWDGFKGTFKAGSTVKFRHEFKDSDANQSNGTYKMFVNGGQVCDIQGFKSRVSGGLKRPFIGVGLQNEWGSRSTNAMTLTGILMQEGSIAPEPLPAPAPVPTPTPIPNPSPFVVVSKADYDSFLNTVLNAVETFKGKVKPQ